MKRSLRENQSSVFKKVDIVSIDSWFEVSGKEIQHMKK